MNPLITVVIPVRNGSNFLAEAIDSALSQSWPRVEVIVVDDGSNDDGQTARVALSYGERIRFVQQPHGGVSSALNAGIREMAGEYFAWLSHDDVFFPEKLERQVEALRRYGADTIVYTDYELADPQLKRIKAKVMPDVAPGRFRLWLMADSGLHGGTILAPRACFAGEPFDERLATTQDYDMWFRLARHHRFVRVPEVLLKYRIHGEQESWTNMRRVAEGNRLLIEFLDELGPDEVRAATDEPPSAVYLRAAVRFKLRGYLEAASRAFELSTQELSSAAERFAPRRLVMLAAYHLAHPLLRPMYWWKRLHFGTARVHPQ
jgi:glycosyltransferase involved in cell wall biosynthesis